MMKKKLRFFLGLTAFCLLTLCQIQAQNADALRVVNSAFETFGGETKLKSLTSIYASAKGFEYRSAEVQGYQPDKQSTAPLEEKVAVFMDGVRLAYEYHIGRHDGTFRWRKVIFSPERRIFADFIEKTASASAIKYPSLERTQTARPLPHTILLEAAANSLSLKFEGVRRYDERDHDVISFLPAAAKVPLIFYFDKKTHLLSKYEYKADFSGIGETVIEYTYADYRQHPQLKWFPSRHEIIIGGNIYRTMNYEKVTVDSHEAEAMLKLPSDLEGFIAAPESVGEIADGVYIVYRLGGYQPLFIEFKDFVLVMEAPSSHPSLENAPIENPSNPNELSEKLIAIIKKTVKNKPIRYIVPTHFHDDHSGGIRAFIAEGAIVLSPSGDKTFYENLAAAKFSAIPEIPKSSLKIETLDDKRVISDGERTVELINVKGNPHTADNIIAYLPKENYLYQGDLFYYNGDATFPQRGRMTVMPFFADWLRKNNISPARIYGFHSLSFATMEHVEKVLPPPAR